MLARAVVIGGASTGETLIKKYTPRLKGIIGFEPFPGTLDLKIDRKLDFRAYSSETIEHILLNGHRFVEAYLAPARLHVPGEAYDCWAFWHMGQDKSTHRDIVEIIAPDNLRKKLGLKDGDVVELELFEHPPRREKHFSGGETRLSR